MKLIKKGNAKIHKSCGIFNLPTSVCKHQCRGCYARKSELRFPIVLESRNRNLEASMDTDKFITDMVAEITASKVKVFRFHESGDFYNQSYIGAWQVITQLCPDVKFYGYTKANHLNFSIFESMHNVNLIRSITEIGFNFGNAKHCEELQEMGYELCPCVKGSTVECMKDCTICATSQKVCFLIH